MIISGSFSALFLEELKTRLQEGAKKDITFVDHINIVLIHSMSIFFQGTSRIREIKIKVLGVMMTNNNKPW